MDFDSAFCRENATSKENHQTSKIVKSTHIYSNAPLPVSSIWPVMWSITIHGPPSCIKLRSCYPLRNKAVLLKWFVSFLPVDPSHWRWEFSLSLFTLLLRARARYMTWRVNFVRSKDAEKQLVRTSLILLKRRLNTVIENNKITNTGMNIKWLTL